MSKENSSRGKVLFLSIVLYVIFIYVIQISEPDFLYIKDNNKIRSIQFGYGGDKKIICLSSLCVFCPLIFYLFFSLLF